MLMAAALSAVMMMGAPASAQQIDLNTVTCKQFIESPQDTIGLFLMWLDGYYHDEDDPAIVDFDKMKKTAEELGAYCARNPGHSLMTAAEPILTR